MKSRIFYFLLLSFTFSFLLNATDKSPMQKWAVKKPFEQRVFIENNGQYFIDGKLDASTILYGSREGSEHYFFTKNGLTIIAYKRVKRSEREIEAILEKFNIKEEKKKKGEEEKELAYKNIPEFHQEICL